MQYYFALKRRVYENKLHKNTFKTLRDIANFFETSLVCFAGKRFYNTWVNIRF